MARRLIETIANESGTRVAKLYRDAEWNEYRVTFTQDGARMPDADYHTDDKTDARMTAQSWAHAARLMTAH